MKLKLAVSGRGILVICSRGKKRTVQKGVGGGDALVEDE